MAWLRLSRSEGVGPIGFRDLLAHFGSAQAALAQLPELAWRRGRGRRIRISPPADAARELEAVGAMGARLVALCEPDYPRALRVIEDAPPILTLLGPADPNGPPAVAIVGSRNASANGLRMAQRLAADLAAAGYLVVSGLARGIDRAAHEGALAGAAGAGTAAVYAGGADVVYPPEHHDLHRTIAEQGVIIAELPSGTAPQARHFPRRNRLISGLSLGVVVVEAAPKSGSLITARLALEQGREVMAVPGAPSDPRARGCNGLIKNDGGRLVESAEDVIAALTPMVEPLPSAERPPEPATPAIARSNAAPITPPAPRGAPGTKPDLAIERLLGSSPVLIDELIRQSGLLPRDVNLLLVELELAGRLERHPGNRVSLLASQEDTPTRGS